MEKFNGPTQEETEQLYKIASRISEYGPEFTLDLGYGTITMSFTCKESEYEG